MLALSSLTSYKLGEKRLKKGDEVITVAAGFPTTVAPIIQNGLVPVFADNDPITLNIKVDDLPGLLSEKTKAVFITHVLGFNSFSQKLLNELKRRKIKIIEDVCESHGAKFKNKKLGTFGLISNFSFYYAHHMSTIEGGMISTNNTKIYEMARLMRSHGMLREIKNNKLKNIYKKKHDPLIRT